MEQAILRREKDLEGEANEKQAQMRDFENNQLFEHSVDEIAKERSMRMKNELKDGLNM